MFGADEVFAGAGDCAGAAGAAFSPVSAGGCSGAGAGVWAVDAAGDCAVDDWSAAVCVEVGCASDTGAADNG